MNHTEMLITEIYKLSVMLSSNVSEVNTRKQARRVYDLLDAYIKKQAVAAITEQDFTELDEFRVVQSLLKQKFRFKD